ncbi:MAG: AAA family ATPase, partial [Anaerolineales bacterium]|nr:AAA family ATPase [Anaerolineales bacterium]
MKLLERDSPLREIAALFGAVPTDGGRIVLVCGEAGIGKTSLVDHFANAHRGRARILWGACDSLFTPRPLGPLFDIADQLPNEGRARLFADSSRSGLFAAALSELSQALTILVLEDLHWADEATLDLVKYLGRRVQRTRALILATYRDDEMGPTHPLRTVLGDLSSAAAMHRLALAPLSLEAVRVLVGEKDVDPAALHLRTNGNPFFVTEVLASGANGVPVTTRDAVLTRVARLSPLAQSIAALAALMPGGADVGLIEAILHCSPAALDECVERGGLHTVGNALAFRHELARQAVEDSLPVGRLRDLHARILAALESAEAGADTLTRLVHHAVRAGDQAAVLRYAPPAARHASTVGAHREAATLYEAALASGPQLPTPERADLLEGLSFEYYLIDHIEEALLACTGVIQIWQTLGERERAGDSLRWLSRLQWAAGRRAEAEVRADEAIATLEALPPGKALAMAYSNKSQLHMLAWDDAAAIDWGQRALDLAERVGALEIQVHALTNVGSATLLADFEAGVGMLERALLLARANGLHDHASRCYANLSTASVQLHRYAPARRWFEEGLAYTTALDLDFYSVYLLGFQARLCFETGHWAEAEAHAVEALRLSTRPQTITPLPALIALGHLKVRQGDPGAVALL